MRKSLFQKRFLTYLLSFFLLSPFFLQSSNAFLKRKRFNTKARGIGFALELDEAKREAIANRGTNSNRSNSDEENGDSISEPANPTLHEIPTYSTQEEHEEEEELNIFSRNTESRTSRFVNGWAPQVDNAMDSGNEVQLHRDSSGSLELPELESNWDTVSDSYWDTVFDIPIFKNAVCFTCNLETACQKFSDQIGHKSNDKHGDGEFVCKPCFDKINAMSLNTRGKFDCPFCRCEIRVHDEDTYKAKLRRRFSNNVTTGRNSSASLEEMQRRYRTEAETNLADVPYGWRTRRDFADRIALGGIALAMSRRDREENSIMVGPASLTSAARRTTVLDERSHAGRQVSNLGTILARLPSRIPYSVGQSTDGTFRGANDNEGGERTSNSGIEGDTVAIEDNENLSRITEEEILAYEAELHHVQRQLARADRDLYLRARNARVYGYVFCTFVWIIFGGIASFVLGFWH